MGFKEWWISGTITTVLLWGCVAPAADNGRPKVRVLVYDSARVPADVLEKAHVDVTRIFRAAGIELEWLSCTGRSAAECRVVPGGKELILHIVHDGKTANASTFGEAFLGPDGKGRYADIFFDRIAGSHREVDGSASRLLGAIAAHEIGHLLLGLHSHTWSGIMAARWSGKNLQEMDKGEMYFTKDQAVRMQDRMRQENSVATVRPKRVD